MSVIFWLCRYIRITVILKAQITQLDYLFYATTWSRSTMGWYPGRSRNKCPDDNVLFRFWPPVFCGCSGAANISCDSDILYTKLYMCSYDGVQQCLRQGGMCHWTTSRVRNFCLSHFNKLFKLVICLTEVFSFFMHDINKILGAGKFIAAP